MGVSFSGFEPSHICSFLYRRDAFRSGYTVYLTLPHISGGEPEKKLVSWTSRWALTLFALLKISDGDFSSSP